MSLASTPIEVRAVGAWGKIPSQPDFVRHSSGERVSGELEAWLTRAVQGMLAEKAQVPASVVRFVFTTQAADSAVIGVLARSQDSIGRAFPLAIYAAVPGAAASAAFAGIPLAFSPFFARAEAILASAHALSFDDLRAHVSTLEPPTVATLTAAQRRALEALAASSSREFLERAFAGQAEAAYAYGLHTFRTAADAARTTPSSGSTVLACPIAIDVDLLAWLDLGRRLLDAHGSGASCAWIEDEDAPRLLLALGHAPDRLLHFVADPQHTSSRLWPLTTQRVEAILRARDTLGPGFDPAALPPSIDDLWTLLARGAR